MKNSGRTIPGAMFEHKSRRLLLQRLLALAALGETAVLAGCGGGGGSNEGSQIPETPAPEVPETPEVPEIPPASTSFVKRIGDKFYLDGEVFSFGGANAQQATAYVDRSVTASAMDNAASMGARVLRIWGSSLIGAKTGMPETLGSDPAWRPYYQYWDSEANEPAYFDDANGLQYLDNVVFLAKQRGIRLLFNLMDNWDWWWGGVNQYVRWFDLDGHSDFFVNAKARQAYKNWVTYLLNRTNSLTGIKYSEDPTIFAWELCNETSCYGGDGFPMGPYSGSAIEGWIAEMSTHVKSIDPNHLVAVGDQGYFRFRDDAAMGMPYQATNEPDFETVLKMPNIDFGTYHLYPFDTEFGNGSLTPVQYGVRYIKDHQAVARSVGKPAILEEFGARDGSVHSAAFDAWLGTLYDEGGAGFAFYEIGARFADGSSVWGTDGYSIYPDSPGAAVLKKWIDLFNARRS